jgi:hypothetical protein
MSTMTKLLPSSLLALSTLALVAFVPNVTAQRVVLEGFTRAPTFTPPAGCIPSRWTYGVVSYCAKTIDRGRDFWVSINTAAGWVGGDAAFFVKDHVAEARAWWREKYPRNYLTFSSKISDVVPRNAPQGTSCIEYSISVEGAKAIGGQSVLVKQRVEGLTCAWRVGRHAGGNWDVELFWLEAGDEYAPSLAQKPMGSFNVIVRKLFASVRL